MTPGEGEGEGWIGAIPEEITQSHRGPSKGICLRTFRDGPAGHTMRPSRPGNRRRERDWLVSGPAGAPCLDGPGAGLAHDGIGNIQRPPARRFRRAQN
jgi:hypothetical protein